MNALGTSISKSNRSLFSNCRKLSTGVIAHDRGRQNGCDFERPVRGSKLLGASVFDHS